MKKIFALAVALLLGSSVCVEAAILKNNSNYGMKFAQRLSGWGPARWGTWNYLPAGASRNVQDNNMFKVDPTSNRPQNPLSVVFVSKPGKIHLINHNGLDGIAPSITHTETTPSITHRETP